MEKVKKHTSGGATAGAVSEAVDRLCAGSYFTAKAFYLPAEDGAQISMSGEIMAWGNDGSLDYDGRMLRDSLRLFPSMASVSESRLDYFISRGRYTVLCGDSDRGVALLGAVSELLARGITKIVVCADTNEERDSAAATLRMLHTSCGNGVLQTTVFSRQGHAENYSSKMRFSVYGFLTAREPEVLIVGRDSFCRRTNIMRRGGADSLTSLISGSSPAVIVTSSTVAGARSLARCASVFSPSFVLLFAGGNPTLHDAVIYRAAETGKRRRKDADLNQIAME